MFTYNLQLKYMKYTSHIKHVYFYSTYTYPTWKIRKTLSEQNFLQIVQPNELLLP
jgi:hypothetical protein